MCQRVHPHRRNRSYVGIVRDGVAKRATIVSGREIETGVEVTQGVNDGDIVIVAAVVALKDGLRVRTDQSWFPRSEKRRLREPNEPTSLAKQSKTQIARP